MDVRIEPVERNGKPCWKVRLGRRAITFEEELAARTFAAQLHMRLHWLQEQAQAPSGNQQPH